MYALKLTDNGTVSWYDRYGNWGPECERYAMYGKDYARTYARLLAMEMGLDRDLTAFRSLEVVDFLAEDNGDWMTDLEGGHFEIGCFSFDLEGDGDGIYCRGGLGDNEDDFTEYFSIPITLDGIRRKVAEWLLSEAESHAARATIVIEECSQ